MSVKLDKCGGILEAYREIQIAKSLGMKTMLGCMISSSVSVSINTERSRSASVRFFPEANFAASASQSIWLRSIRLGSA